MHHASFAARGFVLVVMGVLARGAMTDPPIPTPESGPCDLLIEVVARGATPLSFRTNGERIRGDGRIRHVGSLGPGPTTGRGIRWTALSDPNPSGGATLEVRLEVQGPFEGTVRLEMPVDPYVRGPVALQCDGSLRGRTDRAGVVVSVPRGEQALTLLVDGRVRGRFGAGPLLVARAAPGAAPPRSWSIGSPADPREPLLVPECLHHLAWRACGRVEPGATGVFTGRLRMLGDPSDFVHRARTVERHPGLVPRSEERVSITVTGRGNRARGGARPNKPAAVVRGIPSGPEEPGTGSAIVE